MGRLAVASLLRGMGLAVLHPQPRRQLLYGMGPPGSVEVGADHPMASFDAQVVPVQEVVVREADDQVDAQARIKAELYPIGTLVIAMTVRRCMRRRAVPIPMPAMSAAGAVVPPSAMAEVYETAGSQERGQQHRSQGNNSHEVHLPDRVSADWEKSVSCTPGRLDHLTRRAATAQRIESSRGAVRWIQRPIAPPTLAGYAAKLGVGRETLWAWAQQDPEFAQALEFAQTMEEDLWIVQGLLGVYHFSVVKFVLEKLLRWTDHVEPKRAGGITLLFDAEDKRRP